ncbi:MAG: hypothetical protein ACRESK_03970 [Gammaproteobacteria bacterium]
MLNKSGILLVICHLFACSSQPVSPQAQKEPEILFVYDNGNMFFRDRPINHDDVVIYADGFGGERAAIRVQVPAKPDFFRDSILVERVSSGAVPVADEYPGEVN